MELPVDEAIELLERTPGCLEALLVGLPEAWLAATEGRDTFSARDVLGHLIHGEETDWIPRLGIILEHGEAVTFTPFDRFGFRHKYGRSSLNELLPRFRALRSENLGVLRRLDLSKEHLSLTGKHPGLGPVTLSQLLAAWVVHDLGHIRQIVRVFAKQYREAVGPWREYLSILDGP